VNERLDALVAAHTAERTQPVHRWSEADVWLIAYPDQFGDAGLRGVDAVVSALSPAISGVHVLPFHPSSSDGGFSVEDHAVVDPAVGTWADVDHHATGHRLVADAVINHVSAQGKWFRSHLAGEPESASFFWEVPSGTDLSAVARPRPGPPITAFVRADGTTGDYWTTFGADQVDLDYRSPDVLLAVCEAVFRYVVHGASAVRLDAVAFLWKEPATSSMHLDETHTIVALIRDCLAEIDPAVVLITETNVAHPDNVSYFGSPAEPEAHAVYQFTLPPLVLHAIQTGDAAPLRNWARGLESRLGTTSLNFLASHDGVGLRPGKGWLSRAQISDLAARCRSVGGHVNEAAVAAGIEPYELVATWRSLCGAGEGAPFTDDQLVARHLASHAVALALQGIPLLYVHSLSGSPNAEERAAESGVARDLNRARFSSPDEFLKMTMTGEGVAGPIWRGLREMLDWRRTRRAFHPDSPQRIWAGEGSTFVVERGGDSDHPALVVVNLAGLPAEVEIGGGWRSLAGGDPAPGSLEVEPWSSVWLE
jgi:glycosidase